MHIVITGSAGRLARVLIPRLLANPAIGRISGIDQRAHDFKHPKFTGYVADIRQSTVMKTLQGADALLHMAFVLMGGHLGRGRHQRALIRDINVNASIQLFEAAVAADVQRLLFVSSAAAYGAWPNNPEAIVETQALRAMPGFAYAQDKVAVEHWLDGLESRHPEQRVIRLRPHAILGLHAHPLLRMVLRQPFYPALADPLPLTQCVWEEDVAQAIETALLSAQAAGAYNLAAQPAMSLHAMLAHRHRWTLPFPLGLAQRLHRLAWSVTAMAGEPGWVQGMRHHLALDTDKAQRELHWRPHYDTLACLDALSGKPKPAQ